MRASENMTSVRNYYDFANFKPSNLSLSSLYLSVYLDVGCLALSKTREVVLEYIVERKRMDDLAGSIVDGRFNEQKVSVVLHSYYVWCSL